MSKKRGLGRGLGALIPTSDEGRSALEGTTEISVDDIVPNPHQPRHAFDPVKLQELSDSISEHGLIQPLVVTKAKDGYQLIAGERRWRASKLAGLERVPVIVKETSPQQMLELAIVENIQRADLNPLEEATAYAQLIETFGLTQEAVAERLGKSRSDVGNTVRLLELPDPAKEALALGNITEGHARALLRLNSERDQNNVLETIGQRALNVRQTEALVRQIVTGEQAPKPKRPPLSANDKSMLEEFQSRLGTKVELNRSDEDTGKLTIHFYSEEELQAIFKAILGKDAHL